MAYELVNANVYVDIPMSGRTYVYCRVTNNEGITMDCPLKHQDDPTEEQILVTALAFVEELNASEVRQLEEQQ